MSTHHNHEHAHHPGHFHQQPIADEASRATSAIKPCAHAWSQPAAQHGNERRVWLVIVLTATMMAAEIGAGHIFGSMALVADGWHMATHAAALLITAAAYVFARRHAHDARFAWGTGKVAELGGFTSAVVLAVVAALIAWESVLRAVNPVPIAFEEAIGVAALGLVVNLLCAWLLGEHGHGHSHDHDDEHAHEHGQHHHHDNNLRAAYVHVLADALTSVLAIVALVAGRAWGWTWADPLIGMLGAVVVARWAWGLMRETASVLLDATARGLRLRQDIVQRLSACGFTVDDVHVWQVGAGHFAAIVRVQSADAQARTHGHSHDHSHDHMHCHAALADVPQLRHLNVEVLHVDALDAPTSHASKWNAPSHAVPSA